MSRLRLFIAIDTPPEVKPRIVGLQQQLRDTHADVRWEPPEKLHATLKFLGETDESNLKLITDAVEQIVCRYQPLTLSYRAIGCFPNMHAPRVVWIGMEESSGALGALQLEIEDAMTRLGFEREERGFHPHLTLGRVKGERHLHSLLEKLKTLTFESQPAIIRNIIIVKSELKPSGSVFSTLKSIPLGN